MNEINKKRRFQMPCISVRKFEKSGRNISGFLDSWHGREQLFYFFRKIPKLKLPNYVNNLGKCPKKI